MLLWHALACPGAAFHVPKCLQPVGDTLLPCALPCLQGKLHDFTESSTLTMSKSKVMTNRLDILSVPSSSIVLVFLSRSILFFRLEASGAVQEASLRLPCELGWTFGWLAGAARSPSALNVQ